jgi:hypothetical protein
MTTYNVHIYREMKLLYGGIVADSHEQAAAIARDKPTDQADSIDDCEGETLAALVDVHGDEDYRQSRMIDFEPERLRQAAPKLLAALKGALFALDKNMDGSGPSRQAALAQAHAAIAEAEAAGIPPAEVLPPITAVEPCGGLPGAEHGNTEGA